MQFFCRSWCIHAVQRGRVSMNGRICVSLFSFSTYTWRLLATRRIDFDITISVCLHGFSMRLRSRDVNTMKSFLQEPEKVLRSSMQIQTIDR
mmetsp:Transcript_45880/g.90379  ORF Transcript_45880/g.90379 Transcript_45880/m.90379 type:complete len:92 (+) Transcript_45880:81-356(+)